MRSILLTILIFLCISCCFLPQIKSKPAPQTAEMYITGFYMGELGSLPTGCKIDFVELIDDSVFVCGKASDQLSAESFNIDIWVGSFGIKIYNQNQKHLYPIKQKLLCTTESDGNFCVKFKIKKNHILGMDQVGYDPAIFRIYDYLKDTRLLK